MKRLLIHINKPLNIMKKASFFIFCGLLCAASLRAQTWNCGANGNNVTATLSGGVLTINGTGAMANYNTSSPAPWYDYRESITTVNYTGSVTVIGSLAFRDCVALTDVAIPNSVTSIGGTSVFDGCTALKTITIPNSVTSIGGYVFRNCTSLETVIVSGTLESVGSYAFQNCTALTSESANAIIANLTLINSHTFNGCTGLTSITIPESVTRINNDAFTGTGNIATVYFNARNFSTFFTGSLPGSMTKLIIGSTVNRLPASIFAYTSSLVNVTIHEGCTLIDSRAFAYCTGITSITLPKSVSTIGSGIFSGCANIREITVLWDSPTEVAVTNNDIGFSAAQKKLIVLNIPSGASDAYLASEVWKDFAFIGNATFHTVTYDTLGGSVVAAKTFLDGRTVPKPDDPTRNGHIFSGWYKEMECINAWIFTDVVNRDITLYARWRPAGVNTVFHVKLNGTGNGTSWENAAGSIHDMIDIAVAGDEIWVAAGDYQLPAILDVKEGVNMYGSFAGNETSIDSRAKSDRDGNGKIEPWEYTNETFLIAGGTTFTVMLGTKYIMFAIQTQFDGFTLGNISNHGNAIVNNCSLLRITNGHGATVSNSIIANSSSSITGPTSGIISNLGTVYRGYFNSNYGNMINCVITNHSLYMRYYLQPVSVLGGGVYNGPGGLIMNCTVSNNKLDVHSTRGGSTLGAGIYNDNGTVVNCIVSGNTGHSRLSGGGICNTGGGVVSNCAVYGNTESGIYNFSGTIFCSTILKNSSGNLINSTDGAAYNCITDDSDMAQFINPDAHDYRLKTGSKYIGTGSIENLPDWVINSTDLAGNPRVRNGIIDLGAYSYDDRLIFYKVTFDTQGGSTIAPVEVFFGERITRPSDPNRSGYTFGGWYREASCTAAWNFDTDVVNGRVTLYAKWTEGSVTGAVETGYDASLKIYPNPFTDAVRIVGAEVEMRHTLSLQIINSAGEIVHTQIITSPDETIRLVHLPAGVYFIRLEKDGKVKMVKVIKNR
jgi:uncharacterized repeat protein (TIGR02543 family)